jgi:pimeloyl-ACP methyl ester carboxylesterase
VRLALAAITVVLAACGHKPPPPPVDDGGGSDDTFAANAKVTPVAFSVDVKGSGGRPIILIPGLGCPGSVWDETVAHLGDDYEAHILTLAGFAGLPAIKEPLSKAVRRDLTRYIRAKKLRDPIIVGHSMGGFIAYWIASYHPDLVGPTIIVDAGPALSGDLDEAKALRKQWKNATDEEFVSTTRLVFMSMTTDAKRMEPVLAGVVKSDRVAIGNAVYEMMTTDLTDKVEEIKAPVLILAADGGYQKRIREQVAPIPNHEIVVLPKSKHFVMFDDPTGFFAAIDKFLADNPAEKRRSE